MTRRKRRRGGRHSERGGASGRVTPRGTRPEERLRSPDAIGYGTGSRLDMLMDDADYVVEQYPDMADLAAVERWASHVQFEVRSSASPGGLRAPLVLSRAVSEGGPAGTALAAAIAAYGPDDQRDRARRAVERLVADGCRAPVWIQALGAVEPVRAVRLTDEWGEHGALDIHFRHRVAGTHRLRIGIHPFRAGMAHPVALFAAGDEAAEAAAGFSAEEISLADARAVAAPGIELLEGALADAYDDETDLDPSHDLFALVRQRVGLLPAGGTAPEKPSPSFEEIAAPFGDFAARPPGYGEDADHLYSLMRSLAGFVANCWDRDPLRWTPPRIEAFLEEWVPDYGHYCHQCRDLHEPPPDADWLPTFRSAFLRWLRFAAARRGLPDGTRDANVAAARASLKNLARRFADDRAPLE